MPTDDSFAITDAAKDAIKSLLREHKERSGKEAVPAIVWLDSNLNRHVEFESQPAIGMYDDRSKIENDIVTINGLDLVLAVADADKARFIGKTLDYQTNRFVVR
jgi:hypothetical protein